MTALLPALCSSVRSGTGPTVSRRYRPFPGVLPSTLTKEVDMKRIVRTGIAASCAGLIGIAGLPLSAPAQQQPPAATNTPSMAPMAPAPGMGREMMRGQGMGRGMAQPGTGSNAADQCCSGQQMMQMGEQMRTMGQRMTGHHATAQDEQQMGRQMMDMGQQMQNMGRQMSEHGTSQMPSQGAATS